MMDTDCCTQVLADGLEFVQLHLAGLNALSLHFGYQETDDFQVHV